MSKSKLGFYMWGYDNLESIDYIFGKLRESYPDSDIVISSDGGLDFSEVALKHHCKKFINGTESHGYCDSRNTGGRYGWKVSQAKLWLDRVYEACQTIENEYVMLMEEDVLVKKRFPFPAVDIIMIPNIKNPIGGPGMSWIEAKSGRTDYPYYSAGGGSIIKRDAFIKAYENHIDSFVEEYENIYQKSMDLGFLGWGWCDSIVCAIMYADGCSISTALPIIESGNEEDDYPIIHAFKKYYRKNLNVEKPEKKIVFYHAHLDGAYKMVIQEQLFKVFVSGLYDECDRIEMRISSPDESRIPWVLNLVKNYKKIRPKSIKIDKSKYPAGFRESKLSILEMAETADKEAGYYCYFHTKGVSNSGYLIDMWRQSCDYATVYEWRKNIKMLDEGYDAVGPNLRYKPRAHFSGTYFWSTHKYMRSLKKDFLLDVQDIFLEEFWIGTGKGAKLGSTFESGHEAPYLVESSINTYIKTQGDGHKDDQRKNLVLIPSVVRNPVFSYFSEDERLEQLLVTIDSVKEKIPDSYIVVMEGGSEDQKDKESMYESGADFVFSYDLAKNNKRLSDPNKSKSYGEITLFLEFFSTEKFKEIKENVKSISKVGGRGVLSEHFVFNEKEECVIFWSQTSWSGSPSCSGRYWKIPISKFDHYIERLNLLYDNIHNVIDIEHGFYEYDVIPLKDVLPDKPTGILLPVASSGELEIS